MKAKISIQSHSVLHTYSCICCLLFSNVSVTLDRGCPWHPPISQCGRIGPVFLIPYGPYSPHQSIHQCMPSLFTLPGVHSCGTGHHIGSPYTAPQGLLQGCNAAPCSCARGPGWSTYGPASTPWVLGFTQGIFLSAFQAIKQGWC